MVRTDRNEKQTSNTVVDATTASRAAEGANSGRGRGTNERVPRVADESRDYIMSADGSIAGSKTKGKNGKLSATSGRRKGKGKGQGGRNQGETNYGEEEISTMLDIVEEVEPFGLNMWAVVHSKYAAWRFQAIYPTRTIDGIRSKFDNLSNTRKSTENHTYPPKVGRAKRIARQIANSFESQNLGGVPNEQRESDDTVDLTGEQNDDDRINLKRARLGARNMKRKAGVKSSNVRMNTDAELLKCVEQVTDKFTVIADTFAGNSVANNGNLVKDEVRKELKQTNDSLEELKKLFRANIAKVNPNSK